MPEEKEISLKDFLDKASQWFRYLLSRWILIGAISVIGASLGLWYAYRAKPKYSASVSFVLSSSNMNSTGLLGLASQFGLDLNGGNTDVFAGENIIALMKSRRMVEEALFLQPSEVKESLVNIIAKEMKLNERWAAKERTKEAYPFPADRNKMSRIQDSLFRSIYLDLTKRMLDVVKPEKNQSIYTVTCISTNELFSYYLTKYLVSVTSAFYITTKTSTAKKNLDMLQNEADSLRQVLGQTITSVGAQTDKTFNLNPGYQVQRSGAQQSQVRGAAYGEAYGEVLKNLEIAKITLQKETPLYQIIDEPTLPLLQEKPGKLMSLIAGGFFACFLTVGFLTVRKIIKSA